MTRTTLHDLDVRLRLVSGYLGRPEYEWRHEDGRNIATVGALYLDRSYGGQRLHEVVSESGAVREHSPRCTTGEMALFLDGMLAAMRLGEDSGPRPVTERITERELAELLTGPTSGGNAARLAAYVYGHGPEFDARPQN